MKEARISYGYIVLSHSTKAGSRNRLSIIILLISFMKEGWVESTFVLFFLSAPRGHISLPYIHSQRLLE